MEVSLVVYVTVEMHETNRVLRQLECKTSVLNVLHAYAIGTSDDNDANNYYRLSITDDAQWQPRMQGSQLTEGEEEELPIPQPQRPQSCTEAKPRRNPTRNRRPPRCSTNSD
ncbi:hypothetical protein J1N35_018365 [Gossypium stocksii]|uniref:Uncharacterized protein n=1 Tax=Gossypium stocksii TaxID=47602 RepID=A0A9D3VQJ0_9ROSI|nr:hypothetical protein J1N35_018365 [Gossypium stocksii]